jgi:hypothetical protein
VTLTHPISLFIHFDTSIHLQLLYLHRSGKRCIVNGRASSLLQLHDALPKGAALKKTLLQVRTATVHMSRLFIFFFVRRRRRRRHRRRRRLRPDYNPNHPTG